MLLFAALLTCGCKGGGDIVKVDGYSIGKLSSTTVSLDGVSAELPIELALTNASSMKITLKHLDAHLYNKKDKEVAWCRLKDGEFPSLKPGRDTIVVPLMVYGASPIALISMAASFKNNMSDYAISYNAKIRASIFTKKYKEEKVPVEDLIEKAQKKEQ